MVLEQHSQKADALKEKAIHSHLLGKIAKRRCEVRKRRALDDRLEQFALGRLYCWQSHGAQSRLDLSMKVRIGPSLKRD